MPQSAELGARGLAGRQVLQRFQAVSSASCAALFSPMSFIDLSGIFLH